MSDDIEVPRRGYDTKDVEAMSRALDSTSARAGKGRRLLVLVLLVVAIGIAVWLIAAKR